MIEHPSRLRLMMVAASICLLLALVFANLSESRTLPLSAQADRIVVEKSAHTMTLLQHGATLKTYRVALGRGGLGQKFRAGDNKVPEGTYLIVAHNAHSAFYRALRVGYPTAIQVRSAREAGVDPGGDIMIHGIRSGLGWIGGFQRYIDWTKGCVAVTDQEIDEIWRAVPDGTPIEIRP